MAPSRPRARFPSPTLAWWLERQLAALGSTWRDGEHQKFSEEFEQQLTQFGRFVESTGDYVPYLIRKAERIEEYQQQR